MSRCSYTPKNLVCSEGTTLAPSIETQVMAPAVKDLATESSLTSLVMWFQLESTDITVENDRLMKICSATLHFSKRSPILKKKQKRIQGLAPWQFQQNSYLSGTLVHAFW